MFKRHSIEIPRQRMCDWIGTVVEQILLLVALALTRSVTASSYIRIDETELEVQTPELPGKLHRGRLWGMLSYERDVYFEYADSRSGDVAERLLSGFQGCVQTDQYSVIILKRISTSVGRCTRAFEYDGANVRIGLGSTKNQVHHLLFVSALHMLKCRGQGRKSLREVAPWRGHRAGKTGSLGAYP